MAHQKIRYGLRSLAAHVLQGQVRAHGLADFYDAVPGRIDAHIPNQDLGAGNHEGGGNEVGGGGDITGNLHLRAVKFIGGFYGSGSILGGNLSAEIAQHKLRVIPGTGRLRDAGDALRVEPGQKNGGFHLSGGHGRIVVNSVKAAALHAQGSAAVVMDAGNFGAHLG